MIANEINLFRQMDTDENNIWPTFRNQIKMIDTKHKIKTQPKITYSDTPCLLSLFLVFIFCASCRCSCMSTYFIFYFDSKTIHLWVQKSTHHVANLLSIDRFLISNTMYPFPIYVRITMQMIYKHVGTYQTMIFKGSNSS